MYTRSRIELMGGLRIVQSDRVITRFRTQKTGALLAYLAYYRGRAHSREHLIEILWPETDLRSGRNSLSLALSSLRHQLEPPGVPHGTILRADRYSVQLHPDAVGTDVAEFEAVLQKARQAGSANERLLFLADAAELYRGELLPGYYEDWCLTERERLLSSYLETLHQLVELLERSGDLDRALGYARRAVSTDSLHEEGHRDVMRLLAAAGQPSAALRQYRELEQRLDEELGEAPSALTRGLAREIERQTAGLPERPARTGRTKGSPSRASAVPTRLPTGTVTFLLTDIEGSTAQWERGGETFTAALTAHHVLLRRTFRLFNGHEVKEAGDGFIIAFERAGDALACVIAAQQALAAHPWPNELGALRVRMALHTGDVELHEGEYHGLVLHHASRMLAAAHGGQVLCSEATAAVGQRQLGPGVGLTDLGVFRLRGVERPERLFQVGYPEMPHQVFPPLRAEAGYAHTLPLQFTRFIGREKALEQLQELVLAENIRLATLTGPGGTGKSRLALELSSRLVESFRGAVWFVPLADLADAGLIVDAIVQALRLPRSPSLNPLEQVVEMLSRQPSLLVLDNFEHLVDEGALLVHTLLERVPSLTCLVTSRQRLDLSGEREFLVPPLQTPAGVPRSSLEEGSPAPPDLEQLSMYESVQLFIDRAQVVKPDFQITNQNAAAVAELCIGLEGIPLAIELAAGRAQVLTPLQMLNQLARRFDFLVSRRRDGTRRHQTLRAAIDWSYRLLPPELQRFFVQLSVFRGGWTLEAAEAVCQEPLALDSLAQLRECSLISAEEHGQETRFGMLETLREYAWERLLELGEAPGVRERHLDWFLSLAEAAAPSYRGPEHSRWLDRLELEHDNLRAALRFSLEKEGGAEASLRLATALNRFWWTRGNVDEGRRWMDTVLARREGAPESVVAKALPPAWRLAWCQSDYASARSLSEEALEIFRRLADTNGVADSLLFLGELELRQGTAEKACSLFEESLRLSRVAQDPDRIANAMILLANCARYHACDYERARSLYQESLSLKRQLGDARSIGSILGSLAYLSEREDDYAAARSLYQESLGIYRALGDKRAIAASLGQLGHLALHQDDYATAQTLFQESVTLALTLGDKKIAAASRLGLGHVARAQNDPQTARSLYEESLAFSQSVDDRQGIAWSLQNLGATLQALGDYEAARVQLEASLALHRDLGIKEGIAWALLGLGDVARSQGNYEAARSLFEESQAVWREVRDNAGLALTYLALGGLARDQADDARATAAYKDGLALYQARGDSVGLVKCLEGLAELACAQEQAARATRLLAAAEVLRTAAGAPSPSTEPAGPERLLTAARETLGEERFAAAWAEGRGLTQEQAIAYALEE